MLAALALAAACIGGNLEDAVNACYAGGDCTIDVPRGTHRLERTIELCPTVELTGDSEQNTFITAPPGRTAIHVLPFGECRNRGLPWHGFVALERLDVGGIKTATASFGILAENKVRIRRLRVHNFTQGVRISSDERRKVPGNANLWEMERVDVWYTDHAGVYVQGGDVNVGYARHVSVHSGVCQNPEAFTSLGPCAGIRGEPFLGGVWVASHVSDANGHRSYDFPARNGPEVLIGPYAETGDAASWVGPVSSVIGGKSHWEGPGIRVMGQRLNGLILENGRDPANHVTLFLGEPAGPGAFFAAVPLLGYPLRLKYELGSDSFRFDIANLNKGAALRIQAVEGKYKLGTVRLRSMLFQWEDN